MKKSKEQQVKDWFKKAYSDLKIARREMCAPDPAMDAVCFHFQQAVEKLLKAWLIWHDVAFKPTHNIEALLGACENTDPGFAQLGLAKDLTPYAVDVRYGDRFFVPSQQDTEKAARIAKEVEEFVVAKFASIGFKPI